MANKNYKRCPRCNAKASIVAKVCSTCNLKFERLKNLSNQEAKKAIKSGENEKVLNVTERPKDVSKKKFYLLYILLGWLGIYNIYIGKFKRGYYSLITMSAFLITFIIEEILFFNGIDTSALNYYVVGPICTFAVFGILIWFMDLVAMLTKSFKYPASITSEEYLNILADSYKANRKIKKVDVKPNNK